MGLLDKFIKKDKGNFACALDVGTEFVKALVFEIRDDGKGHVVGVGKQRQGLGDMHSGAVTDIAGVINNCAKAF